MNRSRLVMVVCAALALVGFSSARAAAEEHPRLHEALYEMRHAKTELKEAKPDFGGHRVKAIEALDDAITQVEAALKAVGDNIKGTEPSKDVYKEYKNFPHIRHGLAAAKLARKELKDAAHDYKGHRAKAVEALDAVITQLDKAIEYAK